MARWTTLVGLALLGSSLAFPAAAQWKWRDKNNQVQYSDLPPPLGTPDKDILQRPLGANVRLAPIGNAPAAGASAAPLLAPRASDAELEAKRRKAEQEVADKKKAEDTAAAAVRADNCNRAKSEMRTLDSGIRLTRSNDKGEIEYLDDAARAREAQRSRDLIASQCK